MQLTIIRHGPTLGNALRQWVGATDMPLSEEGLRLTRAARRDEGLARVFVTPLRRTQQTAAILFPRARQVIVPGLQEMNFGVFEGKTHEQLAEDPDYIRWQAGDGMEPMPGGEGRRGFSLRAAAALDALVREQIAQGEQSLHILAHGGTIMALLSALGKPKRHYQEWWVENLCGYRMRIDAQRWAQQPRLYDIEAVSYLS